MGAEVSVQLDNNNLVAEKHAAVESIQATPSTVKPYLGSKTFAANENYADSSTEFVTLDAV